MSTRDIRAHLREMYDVEVSPELISRIIDGVLDELAGPAAFGGDDLVISLVAKGLTTGEVQAHLAEIYGAQVSRETISNITGRVLDGLADWQSRPLDPVYAVLFLLVPVAVARLSCTESRSAQQCTIWVT
jgi:transposase-like protein